MLKFMLDSFRLLKEMKKMVMFPRTYNLELIMKKIVEKKGKCLILWWEI